jgi:hypothetical protein
MINYFDEEIKKYEIQIKDKNVGLYKDLKLQITSIKELFKNKKTKKT